MPIVTPAPVGRRQRGVWLPTLSPPPLMVDTFTGVVDTFLENHTADTGQAWTNLGGAGANRLTGDGCVYRNATPGMFSLGPALATADHQIDLLLNVKSVLASDLVIVGGRLVDATNMYRVYLTPTAVTVDKLVANAATTLGSPFAITLTTGAHTMSLRMVGNQISGLWDGAVVIGPVTDSAFAAAGKVAQRVGATTTPTQTTSTGAQADKITVTAL